MKHLKPFIISFVIITDLFFCCYSFNYAQQRISEEDYQLEWLETEKVYLQEYIRRTKEEERKKKIQWYLEEGKKCLVRKEYPLALAYFRKILQLEEEIGLREHTDEVKKFIDQIERTVKAQTEQELDRQFKQDWARWKKGVSKIVERMPLVYLEKEIEREREKKRLEKLTRKKKRMEELHQRCLSNKKFKEEIKQLFKKGELEKVIERCDIELAINKDKRRVNYFKEIALRRLKRRERLRQQKERAQLRILERKRRRQQKREAELERERIKQKQREKLREERRGKRQQKIKRIEERRKNLQIRHHLRKAQVFYKKGYFLKAIEELKKILSLEPTNLMAKFLFSEIRSRLQEIDTFLKSTTPQ